MRAEADGACVVFYRTVEVAVPAFLHGAFEVIESGFGGSRLGEDRYREQQGDKCKRDRIAAHGRPSLKVEARPPGALRCGRRRCSLSAARRSNLYCHPEPRCYRK